MTKIVSWLFLAFLLLSIESYAQEAPIIERSKDIELIDGQSFYIHTVKKGHTVFSIGKAYGVSKEEIYQYNPGSENGIQIDQQLKIPVTKRIIGAPRVKQDSLTPNGDFIYHRVVKGETLYRIMKNFNVDQDILIKHNPGLTANLQPEQIIIIPTEQKLISDKARSLYGEVIDYKVKKKDTYFKLEDRYGVNQMQLEQLNPKLASTGLQKGLVILVPANLKELDSLPKYTQIDIDSLYTPVELLIVDSLTTVLNCDSIYARNDTFRIALMMPFYSDLVGDIRTSSAFYVKDVNTYKSFTFIQFYEGFLMALDSMKQKGFNAEVFVYDTKGDTAEINKIIQKDEFKSLDLIIGPLFTQNIDLVLQASNEYNIKVVSPFSKDVSLVKNNPNLFKVAPSTASIVGNSCEWVADSMPNARILVIHDGSEEEEVIISLMKKSFREHMSNGLDSNQMFVYTYKNEGMDKLKKNISTDHKNIVVNIVDNEAYVSNFVRDLNNMTEDFEIYVLGSEMRWKRYKTLEIKYLVDLNLTLSSSYFIDPNDSLVINFESRFVDNYKTLPISLAYSGFDISWYFMNALYYYGSGFESCIHNLDLQTMHTRFDFKQNVQSDAFENSWLNIFQYNDYQLINKRD